MDDANLVYFIIFNKKIQLLCHVAKINWATWIDLRPSNKDD
jgi:hypothetical protein